MIHLSIKGWLLRGSLLVTVLTLGCLLILPLRTVIRHVTLFAIAKTLIGSVRCTSLHGGCWMCSFGMVLADHPTAASASAAGASCAAGTDTVPLIGWPMVPLLETLLGVGTLVIVASRGLSLKPPLLGIHFLVLIVNHNRAVHQCLKVRVGVRHELELKAIVQPLEKETLFLVVLSHIIRGIA
jgi:hypothetical protein